MADLLIGVALKWVDLRTEVDPLTGQIVDDGRSHGCSAADHAALEWALRLAAAWDAELVVATVGPPEADALLRGAVAHGATRAVRIAPSGDGEHAPASDEVALLLAEVLAGADIVWCGDYSLDGGSGSVPAFLAAHLGAAQALGLVQLEIGDPGSLTVTRRLDQGRREVLAVSAPAVLSVEGSSAELRRAGLAAVLAARDVEIEVRTAPAARPRRARVVRRAPYRPRAQTIATASPELDVRDRILALTGALVERTPPRTVHADTAEAADLILEQLRAWGHLGVSDLGDRTSPDIGHERPVVLVPLGSTEQHGPHLPVDTDTRIAVALCAQAGGALAGRPGVPAVRVAPAVAYGASGEHQGFAGTLSIGQDALERVVVELARSAGDDYPLVVLVNGHGGNAEPLARARATLEHEGRPVVVWSPRLVDGDSHAGRTETSVLLALAPEVVHLDRAEPGVTTPLPELLADLRAGGLVAVTPNGVLGDPTGATAEEGRAILEVWAADLAAAILAALRDRPRSASD